MVGNNSFVAAIPRFKIESRSSTLLIQLIGKQLARLLLLIKNTVWRTRREEISDGHTCYLLLQSWEDWAKRGKKSATTWLTRINIISSTKIFPLGETCALYYTLWTKRTMFRLISTLQPSISTYSNKYVIIRIIKVSSIQITIYSRFELCIRIVRAHLVFEYSNI